MSRAKLAVTVLFPSIVRVVGLTPPVRSPVHSTKWWWSAGSAVRLTTVPASYVPPGGASVTVPPPTRSITIASV